MDEPRELPMFPLGCVLLPSMLLPLRVFEPRYRQLVADLRTARTAEFGVVLIERGSEVGGGDVRCGVGCVASVLELEPGPDGQWFMSCIGTSRVGVEQWLPDDPYPRALVRELTEAPAPAGLGSDVRELEGRFRRLLALASEADVWSVPVDVPLSDEPVAAIYEMAALSPIGPFDRQRVLAEDEPGRRARMLGDLLDDGCRLVLARLGGM